MILDKIFDTKIEEVAALYAQMGIADWRAQAKNAEPPRGFLDALKEAKRAPALIAEVKKGSPSAGLIRPDFDPVSIAIEYELAGANALSVLTDITYFGGRNEYLAQVKSEVSLPILRKDFVINPVQVFESRLLGADAILLIIRWLSEDKIKELFDLANEMSLDVLFETHSEKEIEIAVNCGAKIIGVNNRDLDDFSTRLELSQMLLPLIPDPIFKVSESALKIQEDVEKVVQWGAECVLIGTAFCEKPIILDAVKQIMPWGER